MPLENIIQTIIAIGTVLGVWIALRTETRKESEATGKADAKLHIAIELLSEMRSDLKKIPELVVRVGTLETAVSKHLSDHRELRGEVQEARDMAMRAGHHDGE